MKTVDAPEHPALSYGSLLEKIEIMRSSLRWPQQLDRPQIERLLSQTGALREDVLRLSRTERLVQAKSLETSPTELSIRKRREALLERDFQFDGVFGDCRQLIESLEIAEKAAPTDLPVLIEGESGTGKELMAKVVHANGTRTEQPLITVNCGAIPDNLLESELFGHKRGAFTGASADRAGKFESANGGTIFLDEIGELPLNGQVKLLRVLQSNEIQRVGSDKSVHVDARIVAATNRNLLSMCQEGKFREDLYYRLSIIQITIPPLRERKDEIPVLIEFLSQEAADRLARPPVELSRKLQHFLLHYEYPGNIRELRNLLFRLSCLAGPTADIEHLPPHLHATGAKKTRTPAGDAAVVDSGVGRQTESGVPEQDSEQPRLQDTIVVSEPDLSDISIDDVSLTDAKRIASDAAEKRVLESGLLQTRGNVTELARRIDMNRAHVQTLLKKHDISSKDFRKSSSASAAVSRGSTEEMATE